MHNTNVTTYRLRNGTELWTDCVHEMYRNWSAKHFGISPEDPWLSRDVALVNEMSKNTRAARLLAEMLDALSSDPARLDEARRYNEKLREEIDELRQTNEELAQKLTEARWKAAMQEARWRT